MTNDKATPRPWRAAKENDEFLVLPDAEGGTIASVFGDNQKEQKANASLIVKAVNNFDVLLEACKEAKRILTSGELNNVKNIKNHPKGFLEACAKINQAINQATK